MTFTVAVPGGSLEVHEWPARDPGAPVVPAEEVPDTNHYSIVVGDAGARVVAEHIMKGVSHAHSS